MTHSKKQALFFVILVMLIVACVSTPLTPDSTQVADQVGTSVAMTVTALNRIPTSTETPLPTPTEPASPTPSFITLTPAPVVIVSTVKPNYACDIIDQRPYDDTSFRPNDSFDIHWTIVNTGALRWEHGTFIEYQEGPIMTDLKRIDLPRLKPGEKYEVVLDAKAPEELDRQVMVWAVIGPDADGKNYQWMCYPYVRIVVGN